jgi:hypothetical protein
MDNLSLDFIGRALHCSTYKFGNVNLKNLAAKGILDANILIFSFQHLSQTCLAPINNWQVTLGVLRKKPYRSS